MYNYVEITGTIPGTYIQQSRLAHSQSVSASSSTDIAKLLRSPPSEPIFKESLEDSHGVDQSSTNTRCNEVRGSDYNPTEVTGDPALRFLSELEEVYELEEIILTPEEEEALLIETTYGALFSHLWWTLWALIQSQISSINFGFIVSTTCILF